MANSFSLKSIRISVTLHDGAFSGGGGAKVIEGLACEVSVEKPGLPDKNRAGVKIWGLGYEDMAQLTMLSFRPLEAQRNLLRIEAGERGGPLSLVFEGEIMTAYADFNQAPDPCMRFKAETGDYVQQMASPGISVNGVAPVDRLFAQFAREAGYGYRNEGVASSVKNAWFPGSPLDKMYKLAHDVGCDLIIDDGEVVILPEGRPRRGHTVFLSKETGLIGYPTFNQDGISCACLYNPALRYGGLIEVRSIVPRATGVWCVTKLSHTLSACMPGGGIWESRVEAAFTGRDTALIS